jgi:hypothetical protein
MKKMYLIITLCLLVCVASLQQAFTKQHEVELCGIEIPSYMKGIKFNTNCKNIKEKDVKIVVKKINELPKLPEEVIYQTISENDGLGDGVELTNDGSFIITDEESAKKYEEMLLERYPYSVRYVNFDCDCFTEKNRVCSKSLSTREWCLYNANSEYIKKEDGSYYRYYSKEQNAKIIERDHSNNQLFDSNINKTEIRVYERALSIMKKDNESLIFKTFFNVENTPIETFEAGEYLDLMSGVFDSGRQVNIITTK